MRWRQFRVPVRIESPVCGRSSDGGGGGRPAGGHWVRADQGHGEATDVTTVVCLSLQVCVCVCKLEDMFLFVFVSRLISVCVSLCTMSTSCVCACVSVLSLPHGSPDSLVVMANDVIV